MLSVIVIWIYMFLTTFLIGYGILGLVTQRVPYMVKHPDAYIICGFAGITVYAQFYSLFGRVGMAANLVVCVAALIIAWSSRQRLGSMLRKMWNDIRENQSGERGKMFIILFLFLLFAYGTSRGIIHYDTSLYHAQSIRWIEEYGVVRGVGNLHCRLAYNSSSFAVSALYSMSFLGGQSYHCAVGWLAYLLAVVCLKIIDSLRNGRVRTGDFARLMCIYYLVNIFDEMVSPASDYFMVLLAFYIVIRWLDLSEEKGRAEEREMFPYAMLCVLGVFLVTVKLSAAPILLLAVCPAYYLIRQKRIKDMMLYIVLGCAAVMPFFIRNILLSGWLVYPFTHIDLFDMEWKIPKGAADYDAREIQVYGRGYTDVTRYDISLTEWIPDWFRALAVTDKVLVSVAVVSTCLLIVYGIGMVCGLWKKRWELLLVQTTMACAFLFWLCTSPLMRYGCVYVYLTSAVVLGGMYNAIASDERKILRLYGVVLAFFFLLYKGVALGKVIVTSYVNDYWLAQKDYENFETLPYEIGGVTFYYPVEGDRVGYESFPSAPSRTEVVFLGQMLDEGFRSANLESE